MKFIKCGVIAAGVGILALGIVMFRKYIGARSNRIPHGKPAGTYEMEDWEFDD